MEFKIITLFILNCVLFSAGYQEGFPGSLADERLDEVSRSQVLNHINITLEPPFPVEDDTGDFYCTGWLDSNVNVTKWYMEWKLDGFIIRGGPFDGSGRRVQEEQWFDGFYYNSHLRIESLSWRNSGRVDCLLTAEVDGGSETVDASTTLSVLARPENILSNISMTVFNNTPFSIYCEAKFPDTGHPYDNVTFKWWKDGNVIVPGKDVNITNEEYRSELQVTGVGMNTNYECEVIYSFGSARSPPFYGVIVINPGDTVCPQTHWYVDWPESAAGTIATQYCMPGYRGWLDYTCNFNGTWGSRSYPCSNDMIGDVRLEIDDIKDGLAAEPGKTMTVSAHLRRAAESIVGDLIHEDIILLLEDVRDLSLLHLDFEDPPFDAEIKNIVEACSTVTDAKYAKDWKNVNGGKYIMYSLDQYCQGISKGKTSYEKEFFTENLDLAIALWTNSSKSLIYRARNTADMVTVPSQTLLEILKYDNGENLIVSSTNYKTADVIYYDKMNDLTPVPSMLTFDIVNVSYGLELASPIKLVFGRKQHTPSEGKVEKCSFWRDRQIWDDSACKTLLVTEDEVQCECYRTGSFALSLWKANMTMDLIINPWNISEGATAVMECAVQIDPPSDQGTFSWTLNQEIVRNGERINIVTIFEPLTQTHMSQLTLTKASWKDTGIARCAYMHMKDVINKTAELYVLAKPRVVIVPMTLTIEENHNFTISCSASVPGSEQPEPSTFKWFRKNGGTDIDISINPSQNETVVPSGHQMSNLTVKASKENLVLYSCAATNRAGTGKIVSSNITVIKAGALTCDAENAGGLLWPKTAAGNFALLPCPGNATGDAHRNCLCNGTWGAPNFDYCVDPIFVDILDEISEVLSGIGADTNKTKEIADKLEGAVSSNQTLKTGNLNASVESVDQLSTFHGTFKESPSYQEIESIVKICSSLIDTRNKDAWEPILQNIIQHASTIMESIDRYSEAIGDFLEELQDFEAPNIVLTIEPWQSGTLSFPRQLDNGEGKWVQNTTDKVQLSNETLSQIARAIGQDSLVVSSAYYKTLEQLLPGTIKPIQEVGSKVLSVSITNLTNEVKFESPINLSFDVNQYIRNNGTLVCSYWNFSFGNGGGWDDSGCETVPSKTSDTNCECTHMTNFAVLVSSYEPGGPVDTALSVITYIGCSLSIVGMLTMMVIYGILWREIHTVVRGNVGRQITLMNLCLVLITANLLFLCGMEATGSKGSCAAIAAILQYLLLVAFALMTVLSVSLYWKVSSFTRGMQTDKMRNVVISIATAWVIPLVIVAISLGATQTHGYGDDHYCWLSDEDGVIWSFIVPVILVIIVNLTILILVIRIKIQSQMFESSSKESGLHPIKQEEMLRSTLWSLLVLVPIMGTNWIFGIVAVSKETIALQFIFALLNSFQGVFLFVFHCIFDASVKKSWQMRFGLTPLERMRKFIRDRQEKRKQSCASPLTSMRNLSTGTEVADHTKDNTVDAYGSQSEENINVSMIIDGFSKDLESEI